MKTLTEFSGFLLKEAMAKKAALLTEGKTEEEVQAALVELMKLDEAKTGFYKNVIDMTSSRMDRVKRVVVALRATEAEKVPESYIEREGHFYLVEYFPSSDSRGSSRDSRDDRGYGNDRGRGGRGGSGGDRGRGGNDRGRGGNDRGGDSRGDSNRGFDRDRGAPAAPSLLPNGEPRGTFAKLIPGAVPVQKPRPPRENRSPRPPRAPGAEGTNANPAGPRSPRAARGPKGAGELRLVLKGESQKMLHGSGTDEKPSEPKEVHILPIVPSTETPQV